MSEEHPSVIELTPQGRGALSTLRVSGAGAMAVVEKFFRARNHRPLGALGLGRPTVGLFGPEHGEQVVILCRDEETVDIHCHGGPAVVAMLVETLQKAGCRLLRWQNWAVEQETTPFAAAALAALAEALTERVAAILLDQYHGALSRALEKISQAVLQGNIRSAREQIDTLLARAELGRRLVQPWSVVLTGRPNVGKSSLLNALVGYNRAIVHHAPGTTRDALTHVTAIDGWPVELCDTAGLGKAASAEEQAGIQLAQQRLAQADLVILVCDYSQVWTEDDQALVEAFPEALLVHNKCDLPATSTRPPGVMTSALTGEGLTKLQEVVSRRLVPQPPPPGAAVPFTPEQVAAIEHWASRIGS